MTPPGRPPWTPSVTLPRWASGYAGPATLPHCPPAPSPATGVPGDYYTVVAMRTRSGPAAHVRRTLRRYGYRWSLIQSEATGRGRGGCSHRSRRGPARRRRRATPPASMASFGAVADVHRGQVLGAGDVQVAQGTGRSRAGLVRVSGRGGGDQLPYPRQEAGLQQTGCLPAQSGDPATGHRRTQQRGQHAGGPAHRQVMGAHQPHGTRHQPRAVLHPPACPRRDIVHRRGAAARAGPRHDPALGHLGTKRGRGASKT